MKKYTAKITNKSYISIHAKTLKDYVLIKPGDECNIELNEEQFKSLYDTITTSPFLKNDVKIEYTENVIKQEQAEEVAVEEAEEPVKEEQKPVEKKRGRPKKIVEPTNYEIKELVQVIDNVTTKEL